MSQKTANMTVDKDKIKVFSRQTAHQGVFRIDRYCLQIKQYDNQWGQTLNWELFERGNAVAVLLYDPQQDKVVLVEQFRLGALNSNRSPWLMEVAAGLVEPNESFADVAKRETLEETGIIIDELIAVSSFWPSPGGSSENTHLFCARVDAREASGIHGLAEEGENIRVVVISTNEALDKVHSGQICSAPTIIALQWLALNKGNIFQSKDYQ